MPQDHSTSRPTTAARLRQLWQQGQRAHAIRGALEAWDDLVKQPGELQWLVGALRAVGLSVESFALQAHLTRQSGNAANDREALVRSVLQSGDPWWARELLAEEGGSSRELERLHIEVELAIGDASALIAAWERAHRDEAARMNAVDWWVRCGRVEEAERLVAAAPGLDVWRARFALWRRDPKTACAVLASMPVSAETRCLEAIAMVQEERWAEAESRLREVCEGNVQAEARSWLATLLRKQGRYADAVREADAADIASPVFNLATRLERHLSSELEYAARETAGKESAFIRLLRAIGVAGRARDGMRTIADLEHASALYPLGVKPDDSLATLGPLLERFGGNRTPHLTTIDHGKLSSYVPPPDPRHLGANIQLVLWTRGPDAVRALYRDLAPTVDGHPFFRIYQGELELWLGNYDEAARVFRAVLQQDASVKWAWIGLGASAMLQGDLQQAQQTWEKGLSITRFAGPTLYVYRGECFRLQGNVPQARRELETALQQKPQRLSAQINMALLGGEADALARAERACMAHAPLLMEQLTGGPAEKLEQVLAAMRGNRSSSPWHVSYHFWGRIWRRSVDENRSR